MDHNLTKESLLVEYRELFPSLFPDLATEIQNTESDDDVYTLIEKKALSYIITDSKKLHLNLTEERFYNLSESERLSLVEDVLSLLSTLDRAEKLTR